MLCRVDIDNSLDESRSKRNSLSRSEAPIGYSERGLPASDFDLTDTIIK
jgi:hypothetical protein